jgi:SAM-dependent methyltransferase
VGIQYWERRVRDHGRRAVLNLGHSDEEFERFTAWQSDQLFPSLRAQLRGDEKSILDFGCGAGRFTPELARLIGGRAIGVDPIPRLLEMASKAEGVEYKIVRDGILPLSDASIDAAWICIVLSSITDPDALALSAREIERVLVPGGLVFLVENVEDKPDKPTFCFRPESFYRDLFGFAPLEHVHSYDDLGETITVMAGRKR